MYIDQDEQNHRVQNTESRFMNSNQKVEADAMAQPYDFISRFDSANRGKTDP
jgi:hypothetical protein